MEKQPSRKTRCIGVLLAGGLLALCGCAVGPDYQQPEIDTPDAWHQALTDGLVSGESSLETWWTVLGDPLLVNLIERAAAGNLVLRQAVERIAEAQARRGVVVGEWFPSIDSQALYERSELSEEIVGEALSDPSDLYSLGLGASWEVDLFGRIRRSVEASNAEVGATLEDYRDVLVVLYAEVAANYVDVRSLQQRIQYAEQNLEGQRDTLEVVRVRNRVGLVGDLDLRQAELNVARTAAFLPDLRQALVAAINRTAVLLGGYPHAVVEDLQDPAPVPLPDEEVNVGFPANVLRQRPDVRSAERNLAAETARIGVATSDLYPRLALLGNMSLDAGSASSLFNGDARAWSIGPQLRWNIFDGGRIRSNVRAQEARTRQALTRYEQTVLEAVEEVENALSAYVQERERLKELRLSAKAAEQSVTLVDILYRTGLVDFLNVLDSERSLFEEQDRLAESEGRVTRNLIRIYRALGGGWSP